MAMIRYPSQMIRREESMSPSALSSKNIPTTYESYQQIVDGIVTSNSDTSINNMNNTISYTNSNKNNPNNTNYSNSSNEKSLLPIPTGSVSRYNSPVGENVGIADISSPVKIDTIQRVVRTVRIS